MSGILVYPDILRRVTTRRPKPRPGDIFAFSHEEGTYWFGRVIRNDVPFMGDLRVGMIYLYTTTSSSLDAPPALSLSSLMCPPLLMYNSAWNRGRLAIIGNTPLTPADLLPRHVFYHPFWKKWLEIDGSLEAGDHRYVEDPGIPCSIYGVTGHHVVGSALCEHLGIPLREM